MSDTDTTDYDEDSEQETPAELREAAKRSRQTAKELEDSRRENAFLKAGIDVDTPQGSMLFDSYKGELTKEAIKSKFEEVFGAPEAPVPTPEADRDTAAMRQALEQQTRDRKDLSSVGSEHTPDDQEIDPRPRAKEKFEEDLGAGVARERAFKDVLNAQIAAANGGAKGATWSGHWTNEELDR